jgi:acyl carrier protein
MTTASGVTTAAIIDLIKEVKPGIGDRAVEPSQSVVEDLGLDSLDLLQLSRKVSREFGTDFDLDAWNAEAETHHRSVASIVAAIGAGSDA